MKSSSAAVSKSIRNSSMSARRLEMGYSRMQGFAQQMVGCTDFASLQLMGGVGVPDRGASVGTYRYGDYSSTGSYERLWAMAGRLV